MDYKRTQIPRRFWATKLEDYETSPRSVEAKLVIVDYVVHMAEHKEAGIGLTLVGDPGTGKTRLMCEIGKAASDAGHSVMYVPFAKYVRWLLNMIQWEDWATAEADWEEMRQVTVKVRNKVDFLLLDDVGKEHTTHTKFAEDEFDFLLRLRYDLAKPTIMTSNLPIEKWAGRYSEAMESFIHEAAPPVEVKAQDYRKR